jgi:hypothetical protein
MTSFRSISDVKAIRDDLDDLRDAVGSLRVSARIDHAFDRIEAIGRMNTSGFLA